MALIERHHMGGDCLNIGCGPSKGVIRAARAWPRPGRQRPASAGPRWGYVPGDFGVALGADASAPGGDRPGWTARSASKGAWGWDVYLGDARFTGPDTRGGGGATLTFRGPSIATGGPASMIAPAGLDEVGVLTNETVSPLTELPPASLVIGGGPIGCEWPKSFRRMGSEVRWGPPDPHSFREDAEPSRIVEEAPGPGRGPWSSNGAKLKSAPTVRGNSGCSTWSNDRRKPHPWRGMAILLAAGRAPNVDGLGLEARRGGVHPRKGVTVDDRTPPDLRRSASGRGVMWAPPYQFTHSCPDHMARIAVQNALSRRKKFSDLVIPWVTYTPRRWAHVGHYPGSAGEGAVSGGHA